MGRQDLLSEVLIINTQQRGRVTPRFPVSAEGTQPRLTALPAAPHLPSGLPPPSLLCCPATGSLGLGSSSSKHPGFSTSCPFSPKTSFSAYFLSVTNNYWIAPSAMLCAGPQGRSEEGGLNFALRVLTLFLLCNSGQAGSRPSLRHPSPPSTAGPPLPSLSPTWHRHHFLVLTSLQAHVSPRLDAQMDFLHSHPRIPSATEQGPAALLGESDG